MANRDISETDQEQTPERAEAPPAASSGDGATQSAPVVRSQLRTDDSHVIACYANFARVTGTPEELILDFGLNPHPMGVPAEPVPVTQRIILNFFTAKRLLQALHMSIQRHEAVFGVLETDVQKRVTPGLLRNR